MYELSSLDLYFLLKELELELSKIDQIYQKDKDELLLQLHKTGHGKQLLKIHLPSLIFLTKYKGDQPDTPPGFCKFLRKRLKQSRLQKIEQLGFERILKLTLTTKDYNYFLFIELFSDGNIILTDENLKIISPLKTGNWKDRTIRGGTLYTYPKREINILTISEEKFKETIKNSEKESIVKALAIDFGLGGKYSEYICEEAIINKEAKPKDIDTKKLYKTIKLILNKKPEGFVKGKFIHPLNLKGTKKEYDSFSKALDEILTEKKITTENQEFSSKKEKELGKIQRIIDGQEKTIEDINKKIDENQRAGELIYNNFQIIDNIIKEINKASENMSFEEIKLKLKGHNIIKDLNQKDKTITIELKE